MGGRWAVATATLASRENWQGLAFRRIDAPTAASRGTGARTPGRSNRVKSSGPNCHTNGWGKSAARIGGFSCSDGDAADPMVVW